MARILPDQEIRKLFGSVILNADEALLNPNGIELRLGKQVSFHSTDEELELPPDSFLKVHPGETISISSLETIDFKASTVRQTYPECMRMGLITPTTTMMREGISQVATKIDAGFRGILNWSLRNGSTKDLMLQYGEPIFKLTIFCLEKGEVPKIPYGDRPKDSYQDADGIVRSTRRIPAHIPKSKIISSSFDQLDPKKQLREAGYPFDHIGTELTNLHGKFEVVSTDVRLMRDEFQRQSTDLTTKIQTETSTLSNKLEETRRTLLERVEAIFERKFLRIAGTIVGALSVLYGGLTYLQSTSLSGGAIAFIAIVAGLVIFLVSRTLTERGAV
jgi:deoxycytidine triphosphate deaminase